jgi:uncharacterized membrane protein
VTDGAARRLPVALAVVLSIAFAIAAHMALVDGLPPAAGALLSLVPLSLLATWSFRRTRHRVAALGAIGAVAAAFALNWHAFESHFPSLFFIEHAGGNLLLATLFGRTLAAGREPLVTTFARIAHGGIDEAVARYTRRVTAAWTAFFLCLFAASSLLYFGGLLAAWSLLANILSPILVGLMFAAEYAIRHRVLPDLERSGILGGMRAFSRHFTAARFEAPR